MAKLRFTFGTMGSGKSTQALQIHHNLRARGLTTLLMTQLDRREGRVSSRLGVSADAEIVEPSSDLFDLIRQRAKSLGHLNAVICDEVQFYQPTQCEQLARVVDELGVDVYTFGLLTTFQGVMFDGSARLMELADTRTEIQVEARCWCGARPPTTPDLSTGSRSSAAPPSSSATPAGQPPARSPMTCCVAATGWRRASRRGAQLELLDVDDARPGDHPDRSGPVEVDPDAVPTPLHATQNAGESS